ncbi:hypothetical protein RJ640_027023 [Escallonia rubra]|uniref:RING-type domain-containing protein n=1 Tax=Escallonia rubra TaxID=112253 RepID=A0AA88UEM1_9ASTE|nr:hypothetical protein RJ640_027023 [Escallonia rubra]
MGSSSSRLGSRPPRATKRATLISSLLVCGASSSHAPLEIEDDPAELLVRSPEHSSIVDKFHSPKKESVLTSGIETGLTSPKVEIAVSSGSSVVATESFCSEDGSGNVEMRNQGKLLSESKESIAPHRLSVDHSSNRASTSYENQPSSDQVSANGRSSIDVSSSFDRILDKDTSQIYSGVRQSSSSSQQELGDPFSDEMSVENHLSEVNAVHDSDSSTAAIVAESQVTSDSLTDDPLQEAIPSGLGFLVSGREQGRRDEGVIQLDVVSITSNILSSSTADTSNREARRNSRRLFWDAFSRRSSRRHSDSRTFVFSTDDSDDIGPNDRWLLDFSGDFFDDGIGGETGYLGSRSHSINERRWHSRSEIWERLRGGRDRSDRRNIICPSGLHPDGTCSCESILMAEETGSRASISRIVLLAEALFEVLDEIHRQPVSLSLSMVSLPAPESVVDSLPLKYHKTKHEAGDSIEQCHICLAEYQEGEKIRVLPCHHEYHMSCVDKWLKEIHGVCPLCRGDVREGFAETSVSNSEIPSL